MNRDQAREEIRIRLEEYLRQKGINPRRKFSCLNPAHNDHNPSMSIDRKHNRVKCFSCGASYDVLDLIGIDNGLTDQRAIFLKAYDLFGIQIDDTAGGTTPHMIGQNQDKSGRNSQEPSSPSRDQEPDLTAYFDECMNRITETTYHRGLPLEILQRFRIGFDPAWKHPKAPKMKPSPRLIIPTSSWSYLARYAGEGDFINYLGEKENKSKVGSVHIFNLSGALAETDRPTFITEGELDAASIVAVGGSALALGSVNFINLFFAELDAFIAENGKPEQPFIIALDNDPAGDKAAKELESGLNRRGLSFYRRNPCEGFKDANEALQKNMASLRAAVESAGNIGEEEKAEYLRTSSAAHLQEFIDGISASVDTPSILTGFPTLDAALDGGLFEGLYVVGAISSLGKTTLVMQMMDQIAAAGTDVLIISLEMARTQLIAKSVSRHTLQIATRDGIKTSNAKTSRGITAGARYINYNPTERKLIQDAITAYREYAEHIFIIEGDGPVGVEYIRQTVEKHIRFTGRKPVVLLDYLQILSPYSERMTDKQNTDRNVLELKRITRDYKLPLIAVSSFNRANYSAAANMAAFKESGAVEYSADVLLGLQLRGAGSNSFDEVAEKKRTPRQVELVILKNREAAVGDKILFDYFAMFNYFRDRGLNG